MVKDDDEPNSLGRKQGLKRKTVLQIIFVAIVIGVIAFAVIYLRRRDPNDAAYSSSDSPVFQPDRNYSQGGNFPLLNSAILAGTEDFWTREFDKADKKYRKPTLVLFNDTISSVCGFPRPASGSFYCPTDGRIYVDLAGTRELINRLGMDGNFAQAYIVTHQVGHHIQRLLSASEQSPAPQQQVVREPNDSSTDLELHADLYSGIMFAHYAKLKGPFDEKVLEKWLSTVSDVAGSLCKENQDCSIPDPFSHGTIQQRLKWFNVGLKMSDSEKTDLLKGKVSL